MLDDALKNYTRENVYPFHMPGHKRHMNFGVDPYQVDITEIEGFDNLHEPEGILLEMTKRIEKLYHSRESFLLVNGSTSGNLTAIFSATDWGDEIIIGRNCHKSVYHAAELRRLKVWYTKPEVDEKGMVTGTPMAEYERAIRLHPKAKAVVITSPTYEGMTEPVKAVAELAHKNGMLLIVDGAHGAHLGFHPYFPKSPLELGADMVIMSLHKTLPSMTQTAVLHINKDAKVESWKVKKYEAMFQSSSPSYVLMYSIARCIGFLEQGESEFDVYKNNLESFYEDCEKLKHIKVECKKGQDPGKLVLDTTKANISGYQLQQRLRESYGIELEMASFYYALAMTSVMDTEEGFFRLKNALFEIDATCQKREGALVALGDCYYIGEKREELFIAAEQPRVVCPLCEAVGKIAGGMISIYPPAVPLLVPGEIIEKEMIQMILQAREAGLTINGLERQKDGREAVSVIVN